MAVELLCLLHGEVLRLLADRCDRHFEGISSGARWAKRAGFINASVAARLYKLDVAFQVTRRLTRPRATALLEQLDSTLPHGRERLQVHGPPNVRAGRLQDISQAHGPPDVHAGRLGELLQAHGQPKVLAGPEVVGCFHYIGSDTECAEDETEGKTEDEYDENEDETEKNEDETEDSFGEEEAEDAEDENVAEYNVGEIECCIDFGALDRAFTRLAARVDAVASADLSEWRLDIQVKTKIRSNV